MQASVTNPCCYVVLQAARVNSVCGRFGKIALEMRVFGYTHSSLLELDSFLGFVSHTRLRVMTTVCSFYMNLCVFFDNPFVRQFEMTFGATKSRKRS